MRSLINNTLTHCVSATYTGYVTVCMIFIIIMHQRINMPFLTRYTFDLNQQKSIEIRDETRLSVTLIFFRDDCRFSRPCSSACVDLRICCNYTWLHCSHKFSMSPWLFSTTIQTHSFLSRFRQGFINCYCDLVIHTRNWYTARWTSLSNTIKSSLIWVNILSLRCQ